MSLRRRILGRGGADELGLLRKEVRALRKETSALRKEVRRSGRESKLADQRRRTELRRIIDVLRLIYDEEPATRRRLYELRDRPDYELAFTDPEPLVSIVIPTFDRPDTLATRSIPSALAQTYRNVEVLVIGDGAAPATEQAVTRFDDPRVRYFNRPVRGPYPADPDALRKVAGGPPFNEGLRRARGRWIAPLADDDAFRPHHVETLLRAAQGQRYEFCYGKARRLTPDGPEAVLGRFPPDGDGAVPSQASLYHSGLRFVEALLGDDLFREAFDKSVTRRMLRAGVRIGFVDNVVSDYHWLPRREGEEPPTRGDEG